MLGKCKSMFNSGNNRHGFMKRFRKPCRRGGGQYFTRSWRSAAVGTHASSPVARSSTLLRTPDTSTTMQLPRTAATEFEFKIVWTDTRSLGKRDDPKHTTSEGPTLACSVQHRRGKVWVLGCCNDVIGAA